MQRCIWRHTIRPPCAHERGRKSHERRRAAALPPRPSPGTLSLSLSLLLSPLPSPLSLVPHSSPLSLSSLSLFPFSLKFSPYPNWLSLSSLLLSLSLVSLLLSLPFLSHLLFSSLFLYSTLRILVSRRLISLSPLDGKYGAAGAPANKAKYGCIGSTWTKIDCKYVRGLQPMARFKYCEIHMYLVFGQFGLWPNIDLWPNTIIRVSHLRVAGGSAHARARRTPRA